MSLQTHTTYRRWVIIATDPSGQRGYYTHMAHWHGDHCTSSNIRLADLFPSKKSAQYAVERWAKVVLTDIEYLPVTVHMKLNNTRRKRK